MQVARFALQFALGIALTYALQRWDKSRLSEEQRERAWNAATWGAVLMWYGPLCMPAWGWVTRRGKGYLHGLVGLVLGVVVTLLIALVAQGVDEVFVWAAGLPPDTPL
ncbi:transcriptional regulator [Polyangium mundeleinium]|uniref:Transcriptional regulator n=1 Tax=Polyangium mundeleinium TaxID=2995306 RepID=A0ABT5F3U9_9BACT|nr:transcriptional regulator [Polyangium mundeleinium]MDC0748289.1 transcriptional regulator [Polyangium mundeleinium]